MANAVVVGVETYARLTERQQETGEKDAVLIAAGWGDQSAARAAPVGSRSARLVGLASRPVLIVPADARLSLKTGSPNGVA